MATENSNGQEPTSAIQQDLRNILLDRYSDNFNGKSKNVALTTTDIFDKVSSHASSILSCLRAISLNSESGNDNEFGITKGEAYWIFQELQDDISELRKFHNILWKECRLAQGFTG